MAKKVLRAYVYKSQSLGDCTNEGLSFDKDVLFISGDGNCHVDGPYNLNEIDEDYLVITKEKGFLRATPKSLLDSKKWVMFGGNFIYSSDSRFPSNSPIKIFDRVENYEN